MKNAPLTVTLHVGSRQVETLDDEYLKRLSQRLSDAMSAYYTAKPEEYRKIKK